MVYILLLLYLLYLTIKYDVLGGKQYKMTHFYIVLIGFILISGFRYRLGTDTYIYMSEFNYYPDLSHLKMSEFSNWRYPPLWIILNSFARTIGGFVLVQFLVSIIHIGLLGLVLKRLSSTLLFSTLLFYYLFDYTRFNMEVMREAISVSCFLMALLALDKGRIISVFLYMVIAFLFHIYSFLVFLLYLFYFKVLAKKPVLSVVSVICIAVICIVEKNFFIDLIVSCVAGTDTIYTDRIISYSQSPMYGETDFNWIGILIIFSLPVLYMIMLFLTKKYYHRYININPQIFNAAIYLSITFILLKYSFIIIVRMCNYFDIFTFLLIGLFFKSIYVKIENFKQRILTFVFLIFIPIFCSYQKKMKKDDLVESEKRYSRYYPYSSIFDKTMDSKREHIFSYR